jgi:hypothetical protein
MTSAACDIVTPPTQTGGSVDVVVELVDVVEVLDVLVVDELLVLLVDELVLVLLVVEVDDVVVVVGVGTTRSTRSFRNSAT